MAKKNQVNLLRQLALLFFLIGFTVCLQEVVRPQPPLTIKEEADQTPLVLELKEKLLYWEEQLHQKPDYVDAYLQASLLSFQLNNHEKGYRYLQLARQLAPNHPQIEKITQFLEE